jgi:autotransporter-associated beta strand protein
MKFLLATFSLVTLALPVAPIDGAQFEPGPNPITGTVTDEPRTINSGTGTIDPGGILSVTGDNVAIKVTGSSIINNNGTIQQTSVLTGGDAGDSRGIRDNTGGLTLTINNGNATNSTALIQTASADCIQMKKANSNVTLNNYGTINSQNSAAGNNQAVAWSEITAGDNTLHNYPTGLIEAREADAVRPGVDGRVINEGRIRAIPSTPSSTPSSSDGSDGVDGQNNSGIVISNNGRLFTRWGGWLGNIHGIIEGRRHGITAGDDHVNVILGVTNQFFCIIRGNNGAGINVDGDGASEVVTIRNFGWITGNGVTGDGDGVDVDGIVDLTNEGLGLIQSLNAVSGDASDASEGISAGGGTIVNFGTIKGNVEGNTNAVGRGITLAGVDKNGTKEPIYANSTITNSGLIKGQTDSAIVVLGAASGFTVTINNESRGKIEGGGNTAAIQTAADSDTLNNAGDVIAGASGKAIDLGAGNDTLNITGGTIQGDISGGSGTNTCTIDPGARNFTYTNSISDFNSVAIKSGVVSFSGASTYSGSTTIKGGTLIAANSTGSGTGNGAVRVIAGALGGNGRIAGDVTIGGSGRALLAPGASGQEEATLTIQGPLKFENGGIYFYTFRANSFLNFRTDKVIANGVKISDSATLMVQGQNQGQLPAGTTFTVISNTAATPIAGAFANLSDGEIIIIQGKRFRANYRGGDGNDLTLTVVL